MTQVVEQICIGLGIALAFGIPSGVLSFHIKQFIRRHRRVNTDTDPWPEFDQHDLTDMDVNWPTLRSAAQQLGLSHTMARQFTYSTTARNNCIGPGTPGLIAERRFTVPGHTNCSCPDCVRVSRESVERVLIWLHERRQAS